MRDLQGAPTALPGDCVRLDPVASVGRRHPAAHRFLASCVSWYMEDTGIFVSGSYDQTVKVWDTNA